MKINEANRNVAFTSSNFRDNSAAWDGGGLIVSHENVNISFERCDFSRNVAVGNDGGSIFVRDANAHISLLHSTISHSRAADKGGGMFLSTLNKNISFISTHIRWQIPLQLQLHSIDMILCHHHCSEICSVEECFIL